MNQDTAMRVAPKDAREKTTSICQEKKNVLSPKSLDRGAMSPDSLFFEKK